MSYVFGIWLPAYVHRVQMSNILLTWYIPCCTIQLFHTLSLAVFASPGQTKLKRYGSL